MKIEYEIILKEILTDDIRNAFADMLKQQGKVQGDPQKKADRCKLICIARIGGEPVSIGAIKVKTNSDFSDKKSGLSDLSDDFEWELGYLYTDPKYTGKGLAKNVARMLVDEFRGSNLMASTEIAANPAMVSILKQLGFRLYGKPWKSAVHDNYLGLFLRFK